MSARFSILSLHRYWIWADRLRSYFEDALLRYKPTGKTPIEQAFHIEISDHMMFMFYWYGALFVVVEGWQELRLSDPEIDSLLSSSHVGRLKRARNGTFHFQQNYFDSRFQEIMEPKDTVDWIRMLHARFGDFFLRELGDAKTN